MNTHFANVWPGGIRLLELLAVFETCKHRLAIAVAVIFNVRFVASRMTTRESQAGAPVRMRWPQWAVLLGVVMGTFGWAQAQPAAIPRAISAAQLVTNTAQFKDLAGTAALMGCDFRLHGVITLVDSRRDLVVLQDATGAVALNVRLADHAFQVGQFVTLEGENGCPSVPGFPAFPFRPAGADIQHSLQAPENWGEYQLTRMRGYLRPPATGEYTFWIASDNSSELWLSGNAAPTDARKIASIPRYGWVEPLEWMRYPSQRSAPILLKAGESYYIEALVEQSTHMQHLAVSWQGPGITQAIIDRPYLTPWKSIGGNTNGILHEYWTNYFAGDLDGLIGSRPFESVLTVEQLRVLTTAPGDLPEPRAITLDQLLLPEENYLWVQVEGRVKFASVDDDAVYIELTDGQSVVPVRLPLLAQEPALLRSNVVFRVQGVCEGMVGPGQTLVPGVIWVPGTNFVSYATPAPPDSDAATMDHVPRLAAPSSAEMQGFYATRGVVTFNDRAFGNDYLFVQENNAAVLVALESPSLKPDLKAGRWVDLGGALAPGKYVPVLTPLVVKELGWHAMPSPLTQPLQANALVNREGRWSELEGIVHAVNTNGALALVGKDSRAYLWIGQTASNQLAGFVDARVRGRGVLLLNLLDAPVLLIPSRKFVDVIEPPPGEPFAIPPQPVAEVFAEAAPAPAHRARVIGTVTYCDTHSFFLEDASGGVRVLTSDQSVPPLESTVEVVAFPTVSGAVRTLREALVRPADTVLAINPARVESGETFSAAQSGRLVQIRATLLAQQTTEIAQVFELQLQQGIFLATLPSQAGRLPNFAAGSRLQITGVRDDRMSATPLPGERHPPAPLLSMLNIMLRTPADVLVLSGPPWWTLKRTLTLVGTLLAAIAVTLFWVYFLRRRLESQQAAQLSFSRHVFERLEDERRRIAVNLHDSLGQSLMVIKNQALLAMLRPAGEPELQQRLNDISTATSQAIEEVRQITHGLRPYQLDRLGLTQAIRASISRAATDSSISFAARVEDIDRLFNPDAEIHIYRIVQEAVTNVVKHSQATEAAVVIKNRTAFVSLSIRDNGAGFDAAKLTARPQQLGYGLSGIAERVRILGATLAIDSRPGGGTSLTIEIPLLTPKHDR